jgi:hypothetical protein
MAITISGSGITSANIADGTIVNADINSSAAIDGSKLTGAGKVLQVVQGTTAVAVSNATNTYVDSGLTATITPSSTSSKILVLVAHTNMSRIGTADPGNVSLQAILLRNATQISDILNDAMLFHYSEQSAGGTGYASQSGPSTQVLDSPASVASITYKTQFRNGKGSFDGVRLQTNNVPSYMTLMEIAG